MPRKDSSNQQRKRGKDKARKRYERNGKYSTKHKRAMEIVMEKRKNVPATQNK